MPGEAFDDARARLLAAMRRVFPDAKPGKGWAGVEVWTAKRPEGAHVENPDGTYDPHVTIIGIADRKAGPTVYFLDPGDYMVLDKHRAPLEGAGLKVMRGCLVHARKAPLPIEPIEAMMREVKARDAAEAKGGATRRPAAVKVVAKAPRKTAKKPAKRSAKKDAKQGAKKSTKKASAKRAASPSKKAATAKTARKVNPSSRKRASR